MTIDACHFEAKKHAIRQTADGWVVSFVVHPNEVNADFAIAPLGTRYMVALVQIGDDELPLPPNVSAHPLRPGVYPSKPVAPSPDARQRYVNSSPGEQAVTRAALLPKDERFRAWIGEKEGYTPGTEATEERAVEFIRTECCFGASRTLIATQPECMDRFIAMETEYLIDIGQMAAPR